MLRRFLELWKETYAAPASEGADAASISTRQNDSLNARTAVETALSELSHAVQHIEETLQRATLDKTRIDTTLREYETHAATLHEKAKAAVHARNDAAATEYLEEQRAAESMIASYKRIEGNIHSTLRRLQEQRRRMVIQREEILAQRSIIEMQLASARTQDEFVRNIQALGLSHEALEQELLETQVQSALQTDEQSIHAAIDEATTRASVQEERAMLLSSLNAELEAERQQQRRLEEETMHKRFRLAFPEKHPPQSLATSAITQQSHHISTHHISSHQISSHQISSHQISSRQPSNEEILHRFFDAPSSPSPADKDSLIPTNPEQKPSSKEEMLKKFFE